MLAHSASSTFHSKKICNSRVVFNGMEGCCPFRSRRARWRAASRLPFRYLRSFSSVVASSRAVQRPGSLCARSATCASWSSWPQLPIGDNPFNLTSLSERVSKNFKVLFASPLMVSARRIAARVVPPAGLDVHLEPRLVGLVRPATVATTLDELCTECQWGQFVYL